MHLHPQIQIPNAFPDTSLNFWLQIQIFHTKIVQSDFLAWNRLVCFDFHLPSRKVFFNKILIGPLICRWVEPSVNVIKKDVMYHKDNLFPAKIEIAFSEMLVIKSCSKELQYFLDKKPSHINAKKNKKSALNSGIQDLSNFDKWWWNLNSKSL